MKPLPPKNKKQRQAQQTQNLLYELRQASTTALKQNFAFDQDRCNRFLELANTRFEKQKAPFIVSQKRRLTWISQTYAKIAMEVLAEEFGFVEEQLSVWLQKVIAIGNAKREQAAPEAEKSAA